MIDKEYGFTGRGGDTEDTEHGLHEAGKGPGTRHKGSQDRRDTRRLSLEVGREKSRQHSHATKARVPLLHGKEKKGFLHKLRIFQMQSTTLEVADIGFPGWPDYPRPERPWVHLH